MRKALVSVHSPEYRPLRNITWDQNKKLYANKYDFYFDVECIPFSNKMNFRKFDLAAGFAKSDEVDWVFCTGTDSMITDFTNDMSFLDEKKSALVVTTDRNGLNADNFFVRTDERGLELCKVMLSLEEAHSDEQAALNRLRGMAEFKDWIEEVPQRTMNSYNYDLYPVPSNRFDMMGQDGQWRYGDFAIHWPGFADAQDLRIQWAQEMLPRIKYV